MSDNWINRRLLTNETEILDSKGNKIHDLIPCNQGAGVPVDKDTHPVLWGKGVTTVPNMPTPVGSPCPYKVIADKT